MHARIVIRWATAGVLFAVATYISATELVDAYGAGPPFYGRTTNMDKWASPWPLVVAVDGIAILSIALLLRPRRRLHKPESNGSID